MHTARPTADQIHAINRQLIALEGRAESESRLVEVTVGVRHDLRSLWIDPYVYRQPDAQALSEDIQQAMRDACTEVDRQAYDIAGSLLPPDSDRRDLAYDPIVRTLDELIGGQ